jgi:hypothetical protein
MRITKALSCSRGLFYTAVVSIAVLVGGAGAASGLTGTTPVARAAASAEPALAAVSVVTSAAMISYPLDEYGPSDSQITTIMKARRIFEIRCMNSLGFQGSNFPALLQTNFNETAKGQFLTFLDPASARLSGYGYVPDPQSARVSPARSQKDISADNLQAAVMNGYVKNVNGHRVPAGGCTDEGLRSLEKGTSGKLPIDPRYLMLQSQTKAIADPRMRQTMAAWSSCMSASGYSYGTPFQAEAATAGPRGIDGNFHAAPTALERRTATADATCRSKVNLLGKWVAVESAYQRKLIIQNHATLDQSHKIITTWLRNATAVVALGH